MQNHAEGRHLPSFSTYLIVLMYYNFAFAQLQWEKCPDFIMWNDRLMDEHIGMKGKYLCLPQGRQGIDHCLSHGRHNWFYLFLHLKPARFSKLFLSPGHYRGIFFREKVRDAFGHTLGPSCCTRIIALLRQLPYCFKRSAI